MVRMTRWQHEYSLMALEVKQAERTFRPWWFCQPSPPSLWWRGRGKYSAPLTPRSPPAEHWVLQPVKEEQIQSWTFYNTFVEHERQRFGAWWGWGWPPFASSPTAPPSLPSPLHQLFPVRTTNISNLMTYSSLFSIFEYSSYRGRLQYYSVLHRRWFQC